MKLIKILDCDIYRDGGSLEGIWQTDERAEWVVTLKIQKGMIGQNPVYALYNCKLNNVKQHQQIRKGSQEHKDIINRIEEWLAEHQIQPEDVKTGIFNSNPFKDLFYELKHGNY